MQWLGQGGSNLRRCHKLAFNENNEYILIKGITGHGIKIQNKPGRQHRDEYTHISACKTSEMWIRLVDISVSVFWLS